MKGHERELTSTGKPPWKSPVVLSVTLHLLIIGIALAGWSWTSPEHEPPPRSISARLISQTPEPSPIVEPVDQPDREEERRAAEQKRKAEEQRKEEARKLAEQQAREAAQQKAEEERKRQQALAREREEEKARAEEAARQKAEAEAKERERKKAAEEKQRQQEAKRKAEEEKRLQEERRKREEAERKKREEEARQEAERKRLEAERKLREQQLEALADEAERSRKAEAERQAQAAAARAREAQMLTESEKYLALIKERLQQAWYPPSSATEQMVAHLQITLLPTGELSGVRLTRSSGNTAFDNSAMGAVRALNRYPIPDDRDTFERYFRQFTIEFNPSGLR
ncbi:cell envelope integrity protein TolA [Marinobacter salinus]|uniref:cell envelope integrity protein TolA n=1 Tax=Marinobacter salinus TaxID=1874317 RepID=UPI000A508AD5|nr:cell envelope integrity protein TolA [Marinobacter salinus]